MNDTINLDDLLKDSSQKQEQPQVIEQPVAVQVDWDEVLTEWSYKLPKGYPTVVDGVFTEREEVEILNEILEDRGFDGVRLPEKKAISAPNLIQEDAGTDAKEITVCIVANLCSQFGSAMVKALSNKENKAAQVLQVAKVKTIKDLATLLVGSKYNYYLGKAEVGTMIDYLGQLGLDPKTKSNKAIEADNIRAGVAIFQRYGVVNLIRDEENFSRVKKHGPSLWKKDYPGQKLEEDNWTPADIFISTGDPSSIAAAAIKATSLVVDEGENKSLNSFFADPRNGNIPTDKFVGISLKLESTGAQAGKGTTFIKTVALAPVKQTVSDISTDTKNSMSSFKGFDRYLNKPNQKDKKQPATKLLDKGLGVLQISRGTKEGKERYAQLKLDSVKKSLEQIGSVGNYYNLKRKPKNILAFVELVEQQAKATASAVRGKKAMFIKSRDRFIEALKNSKVLVKALTDSETLFKEMDKKFETTKERDIYLVQKICTYDFFVDVFDQWSTATKQLKKPFVDKISKVSNPFVALTMFCIAEAGVSPMFTKLKGAHYDDFTHDYTIDIAKSGKNIKVTDSPTAAGFDAKFEISFGTKQYSVTLVFRFASNAIRAEVQSLDVK